MDSPVPKNITRNSPSELKIEWNDSKQSIYSFKELRFACQCALCKHEITGEKLIKLEDIAEDINLTDAKVVGNYAVQFAWSDSHSTGIYTYDYLRKIG